MGVVRPLNYFVWPDPNSEDFLFRLSIAEVKSDGPFSIFPGIERCLIILNGNGCVLNETLILNDQSQPFFFSGEEKIFCKLVNGGFQDFNVMVKKGWKKFEIEKKVLSQYSGKAFVYLTESQELIQLEDDSTTFPEQLCIIVSLT